MCIRDRDASAALTQASQILAKRSANGAPDATAARESLTLVRKAAAAVLPLARPATANTNAQPPAPTASEPALRGAVVDALRAPGGSR